MLKNKNAEDFGLGFNCMAKEVSCENAKPLFVVKVMQYSKYLFKKYNIFQPLSLQ